MKVIQMVQVTQKQKEEIKADATADEIKKTDQETQQALDLLGMLFLNQ